MKVSGWMKWTAVGIVACGLATPLLMGRADAGRLAMAGEYGRHGRFLEKLASLGITDEQRGEIRAILRENRPKAEPLVKQFVAERRALRSLVLKGASEREIRAQAAKLARVGGDLAVLKAQVAPKVRAVLTPEQQEKVDEMIEQFDQRVDEFLDHMGERSEQD